MRYLFSASKIALLKGAPVYEAMLEKMLPDSIEDQGDTTLIEIPVSEIGRAHV